MMRRGLITATLATSAVLLAPVQAHAAAPALGAVSAANLQGVSALLLGTVNPEGLATTYHFEYVDPPGFSSSGFATASKTQITPAGSGSAERRAHAAILGLRPNTLYHYRLVATNSSGTTTGPAEIFSTTQGFGFLPETEGFAVSTPSNAAGSHPYDLTVELGLNLGGEFEGQPGALFPDGDIRNLHVEAPPGLILNPNALPKCTLVKFGTPRASPYEDARSGENCPPNTQIGTAEVGTSLEGGHPRRFGLFNLVPPAGVALQLGFSPYRAPIVFDGSLRPDANAAYTLSLDARNIPQLLDLHHLKLEIWGTPWQGTFNSQRGDCLNEIEPEKSWEDDWWIGKKEMEEGKKPCEGSVVKVNPKTGLDENPPQAYLTLPHRCSGTLAFQATADSWQQPEEVPATALNRNAKGQPVEMNSCLGVDFHPGPSGLLTNVHAASPSGYNFKLEIDNKKFTNPDATAPAPTKKVVVSLPEGVTINPSVGAGLGVCNQAQYAAETAFSNEGEACPNAAKIGNFTARSSLFDEFFKGGIYLGKPDDFATATPGTENPFDALLPAYLVARIPDRGVLIKALGEIAIDEGTGQLTATFDGLPQLPYSELNINFRSSQRAPLLTPPSCGPATSTMDLTPWVGNLGVHATSLSPITADCPDGSVPPFSPEVIAGGVNSNVNSYTPYFVHLVRKDTEQEITSYSLTLPKGITGKLAGIPFCPGAAITEARTKDGFAEAEHPSCPAASQVGHVLSGYGLGNTLAYATGRIYLAGPYHGAPLSVVTINPATVGPFDLGTIVVHSAFQVDPSTAQLRVDSRASDPIPHILRGVLLHLRDVLIYFDRREFVHNPSSCEASELVSTLTGSGAGFDDSADDSFSTSTAYFQLLNCLTLHFRPQLGLRMRGGTRRGAYPQLRATFAARGPGDSNLKEISVTIPHQEFLAQEHIAGICTNARMADRNCPADSIYGSAVAYTPLLDEPLRGNVYLRANPAHQLPDLVASLYSGAVNIVLEGRIGPGKKGGIEALFANLPDQPLERFVMTLNGGKNGLLVNSANICLAPPVASVKALAQNNIGAVFTTKLRGQCHPKSTRPDTPPRPGSGHSSG